MNSSSGGVPICGSPDNGQAEAQGRLSMMMMIRAFSRMVLFYGLFRGEQNDLEDYQFNNSLGGSKFECFRGKHLFICYSDFNIYTASGTKCRLDLFKVLLLLLTQFQTI